MIEAILETALYVDDLDKAGAFYGDILDLELIGRADNRHLFFRCGPGVLLVFNPDETTRVVEGEPFPVPTHGTRGAGHVCFTVTGDDLDAMVKRLTAAGIAIEHETTWPNGARSVYFRDPSGNSLEIAQRRLWNL